MLVERQLIPSDLAGVAPGPESAAVLHGLDLGRLSGYDAVVVLQAYAQLESYVQARKAEVMAEVGLYEPSPGDMEKMACPDKYSADEIRAALTLTRRAAEYEYWLSYFLATRFRRVRDELLRGRIDKARARVFCDWLEDVPEQVADGVVAALLPKAGGWTTSQLKDKIKRLLLAADPGWARRRYERAVRRRRVEGTRHDDGTVTITGQQLPVDQAAAAICRVNAIAQKAKRAGLRTPIDHIRADVFLGLLDGELSGLDDDAIITVLLQAAAEAAHGDEDDYDDQLSDKTFPDPGPDSGLGPDGDADGGPDGGAGFGPDGERPCGGGPSPETPPDPGPGPDIEPDRGPDPGSAGLASEGEPVALDGAGDTSRVGAVGEVRVRVSTLFHLDDFPGELAGWGPIPAHLARRLAKRQICGEWRFAVCDDDGGLLHAGITRRRPAGWPRPPDRPGGSAGAGRSGGPGGSGGPGRSGGPGGASSRNGIVELQIPLTLLRKWQADLPGLEGWAPVITDVIRQLDAARAPTGRFPGSDADGDSGADVDSEADADADADTDADTDSDADSNAEARRRFPSAGLRRWVQIRDRVCTAPGCRAPATRSELDHIHPHSHGGPTTAHNLEAACPHDHDLRDHGWRVIQPTPGQVIWISRTGHRYPVRTPPIIEPLAPPISPWPGTAKADVGIPADQIDPDLDASAYLLSGWEEIPIWWEPAVMPGPGPDPSEQSKKFQQSKKRPLSSTEEVPPF